MAFITDTVIAGTSLRDRFQNLSETIAQVRAKRKVYNTTVSELQSLSDRDLNDLGMSRAMIKGIAIEAAYGK